METTLLPDAQRVINFFKALDSKDVDAATQDWADDHQMHFPSAAAGLNKEVHEGFTRMFLAAFPDIEHVVVDVLEAGNKVIARGYFTGTHEGNFNDIRPRGKKVKTNWIDIIEYNGEGKMVNEWVEMDVMGMMQQLGVVPVNN